MINKISNSPPSPTQDKKNQFQVDDRYIPEQFKEVARGMEAQFAEYMISQMEKSVGESEEESNSASNFYKSLLEGERAQSMTKSGGGKGLGIQEMILEQIYPKRLRNELNFSKYKAQEEKANQKKITMKTDVKGLDRKGEI